MQCLTNGSPGCIPVSFPAIAAPYEATDSLSYLTPWIALVMPPEQEGGIFGFAEFVQAFALLILIYTFTDIKYRFRLETAPVSIFTVTFWVTGIIGLGSLFCDVWFAQRYPLPVFLANRTLWQAFFAILFLILVAIWLWFSFLKPPIFGQRNCLRYAQALYRHLLQGVESDLPVIAAELARSAESIVKFAGNVPIGSVENGEKPSATTLANQILLLIGNRKFSRHIVASAPGTAIEFFQAFSKAEKYNLPVGQFASNISTEALINIDSILYHEDDGYYSGFFGYVRPFTNAIYGDFRLVEALSESKSPLDIDFDMRSALDAKKLAAYSRAVLVTFENGLAIGHWFNHSYALFRAFGLIKDSCGDIYKIGNALALADEKDIYQRLDVTVKFINQAIEIMDKQGVTPTRLRRRGKRQERHEDYYDMIANMMFEIISKASRIEGSGHKNWGIQHNAVWSEFFKFHKSKTRSIVLFKLRRLLYDEICLLKEMPNFRSAPILGLCLNVMGLEVGAKRDHTREEYQLRKATLSWTRRNYLGLVQQQHKVAAACLVSNSRWRWGG